MKTLLIVIGALLIVGVVFIFYNNREHEKVTELFSTAVIIGSGAALLSMTLALKPTSASIRSC